MIKKILLSSVFVSFCIMGGAQSIEKPTVKSKSSFAIIVDDVTFQKTRPALSAYKKSVEKDGLGTYIISHNWKHPQEIRDLLKKLHQQKDGKLEGAVFVGDIPVPMVRDAQHLTSAFKMNQKMNWQRSSVPSDRFYDDFNLEFNFLKQDSARPLLYYFSLSPNTMQNIHMSIYTGRIKPPAIPGKDKYKMIEDYLFKAAKEKEQANKLEHMMVFSGHGYNSESLTAWAGEHIALREQFPHLFRPGNSIKFMNFRMHPNMKFLLMNELQREDLDLAMLHHHGTTQHQLLNGLPYVSNPVPSIENVKSYLRSKVRSAADNPKRNVDEVKAGFVESLGVPMQWMDNALDDSVRIVDSTENANLDINVPDLVGKDFNARFIMLDACFTGSFQLDDYIAGYYPFSGGKNIVTIGSSVGVLQDLWPGELLGLLQYGVRVGNWFKHAADLETHILGDPTFHFTGSTSADLNHGVVFEHKNAGYWEKLLTHSSPDVQGLAMLYLYLIKGDAVSALLKEKYFAYPDGAARMQALSLLALISNDDARDVLKAAVHDPYEYVRRSAAYMIKDIGSDDLIPALVELAITDRHSKRVFAKARDGLNFMNIDNTIKHIRKELAASPHLNENAVYDDLLRSQEYTQRKVNRDRATLIDTNKEEKERMFEVTTLRTYRYHHLIDDLVVIALNKNESTEIRTAALEAMGWYDMSYQRPLIIKTANTLLSDSSADKQIREQALRVKNRLSNRK